MITLFICLSLIAHLYLAAAREFTFPADDYDPAWPPDGSRIAFISKRDDNPEIYIMNTDGNNPLRITQNTSIEQSPAWKS